MVIRRLSVMFLMIGNVNECLRSNFEIGMCLECLESCNCWMGIVSCKVFEFGIFDEIEVNNCFSYYWGLSYGFVM